MVNTPNLIQLQDRALKIYPSSAHLRKQWVDKSRQLYATGRHALLNGGFKRKGF